MSSGMQSIYDQFSSLKGYFSPDKKGDSNLSHLVLFAEKAHQDGHKEIANDSIELYLSLSPPTNQFLIRAYICRGLVIAPQDLSQEDKLQDCLRSFTKALNLAKKSPCYYFLVYNISIILWRILRPFQQPGYYHHFINTLTLVVKSLEDIKENDFKWRLTLLLVLVKAHIDTHQREDANKTATSALQLSKKHVPNLYISTFKQLVELGAIDIKVMEKVFKTNPQLFVFAKLWKIKSQLKQHPLSDIEQMLNKIYQLVIEGECAGKKSSSIPLLSSDLAGPVLIELAEIALQCSLYELTKQCLESVNERDKELELSLRKHLLNAQLITTNLNYTQTDIQIRQDAIISCEDVLMTCVREGLLPLVEFVCVTLWNISLPLLQPSLRHGLLRPLTSVSKSLEQINSLLYGLRLNVHFELAKITADQDNMSAALYHIQQAQILDYKGMHTDQLHWLEHCLKLRNQLYQEPENCLDKATQMIEQIKSSCVGGRPLLISVADLLTDREFSNLLTTSLTDNSSQTVEEMTLKELANKSTKIQHYKETIAKHVAETTNDKVRCWLWSELAKLTRKSMIWDICLLCCLYCIQYDDQRWQYTPTHQIPQKKSNKESRKRGGGGSSLSLTPEHSSSTNLLLSLPYSQCPVSQDKLLLVRLAEIHIIYSECLVTTLECEGLKLGQSATPLSVSLAPEYCIGEHWTTYCNWITSLTTDAHQSMLRSAELGSSIHEHWLVYNSIVCMWNYHHHTLIEGATGQLVKEFRMFYQLMKGSSPQESIMLCQIATVLVRGLTKQWIPSSLPSNDENPIKKTTGRASAKPKKKEGNIIDPDASPDLKEALEICDHVISQFIKIPLSLRRQLLREWVMTKLLLQQPLSIKSLEMEGDSYVDHCKAIVSVDIYQLMGSYNHVYEFPNPPSLEEVVDMVNRCDWEQDNVLQLELYTHLARICQQHCPQLVNTCCQQALKLKDIVNDKNGLLLLSVAASIYGQHTTSIKTALQYFTCCTKFGCQAGSYDQVIQGCRLAWNTGISYVLTDRELLQLPYMEMLSHVMSLAGRRTEGPTPDITPNDLQLISDMYSIIFQVYSDKGEWEKGLEAIEKALWVSPKSLHRSLTEQKIIFKTHLGGTIEGEMNRFQEESPEVLATLWYKAGINCSNGLQQLQYYQQSIELLQSAEHNWQKGEYIIELAQWLHRHGYPSQDVLDHLEWAVKLCSADEGVPQLDRLLHLHVMMSEIATGQCSSEYSLKAVSNCLLIWKGLLGDYPSSLEEWSALSLTDEHIKLITQDEENTAIPSSQTILKPLLTFHFLEILINSLYSHYLHLLALPVLQLQLLIAQYIIKSKVTQLLVQLRLSVLCQELKLAYKNDNDVYLRPEDIASVHSYVIQKRGHFNLESFVVYNEVFIWQVWVKIAFILFSQGLYQSAKELLYEAKLPCETFNDEQTLAKILLCEIKLSIFEKNYDKAIELLKQAEKLPNNYEVWLTIVQYFCQVLDSSEQCELLLKKALDTVQSVIERRPTLQHGHILIAVLTARLLETCQQTSIEKVISAVKILESDGHISDAANILLSLTEHYSILRNNCGEVDYRQRLINCIVWSRHAVRLIQMQYHNAIRLSQPSQDVVLPVQRVLVQAQLVLAKLLLIILRETVDIKKRKMEVFQKKSSIEKVIDDYVHESPVLSELDQQWNDISELAGDESVALLSTTYHLSINDPDLQCQCLSLLGCLLHQISTSISPDPSQQWLTSLSSKDTECVNYSILSTVMRKEEAVTAQVNEIRAIGCLTQTVEVLVSAVSVGLSLQNLTSVQTAALELVNITGRYDPVLCSSYLALYQSCVMSQTFRHVLSQCLSDNCQLSSLLHQQDSLRQQTNPTYQANTLFLDQHYESWRRLYVDCKHLEFMKSFHADVRFFLLQHSQDQSLLYTGYLIPAQPPPPAPKKGQPPLEYVPLSPVVSQCSVSSSDLKDLQKLMRQYKSDVAVFNRQKKSDYTEDMLQNQFEGIVVGLEAYLSDSINVFSTALQEEDQDKELTIVLLIDTELAELPLEALSCLHKKNIKSLSRDFSLQLLHHRLKNMSTTEEEEDKKKTTEKYQPQPSSLLINTTGFKYILDPRNDLHCNFNNTTVSDDIKSVIQTFPKITGKWSGLSGTEHVLSCSEWSPQLQSSTGLLILTSERWLAHVTPQCIAPLSLTNGCGLAIIMDLLTSPQSYHTQTKLDTEKSLKELYLEQPLTSVILLSLIGVNSIWSHQWYVSNENGVSELKTLLTDLLSKTTTTGQLHWSEIIATSTTDNELTTPLMTKSRNLFNSVVYGLPHLTLLTID